MSSELAQKLADDLAEAGACFAFGVAGGGISFDLISRLEARGVKYVPVAHEASGAIMAGAASAVARRLNAVSISIKGPGFANMLPGIIANFYECRPALSLSEAYTRETQPWRMHKRLDHEALCAGVTKYYGGVASSGSWLKGVIAFAESESPGPVHIELIPAASGAAQPEVPSWCRGDGGLDKVLGLIRRSAKPALILGGAAARAIPAGFWNELQVPVATTAAAKGSFNELIPFSAGIITGELGELSPESTVLAEADLVIALGLRNSEVIQPRACAAPLIIIDAVEGASHAGFNASHEVLTRDLLQACTEIRSEILNKGWGEELVRKRAQEIERSLSHAWLPAQAFAIIQEALPRDSRLILDTGLFCTVGETVWKCDSASRFLGSSIARFMGLAVPSAIGAAMAAPGVRTVCVVGDGGIRPYLSDLAIAVEENLPVLFVHMSDGRFGSIAAGREARLANCRALKFESPSMLKAAEALRCPAMKARDTSELLEALRQWQQTTGPLFIELMFDPADYAAMAKRLR